MATATEKNMGAAKIGRGSKKSEEQKSLSKKMEFTGALGGGISSPGGEGNALCIVLPLVENSD